MTVPRIYLPCPMEVGSLCELREEDRTCVRSVLRLKRGDHLVLFDGRGHEYQAMIRQLQGERTIVEILKKYPLQDKPLHITLCQALPKAGKMDFIIQKATELGADEIVPFHSARCVSRLTGEKKMQKAARWRKIAVEAARQCGRADVPVIRPCADFQELFGNGEFGEVRIIFWEEETQTVLGDVLRHPCALQAKDFSIIVGPEGGFLKEEVERAREAGFRSASIGRQILRVETAVLAILSILQYERGSLGGSLGTESER